jgi:hypothetical protein
MVKTREILEKLDSLCVSSYLKFLYRPAYEAGQ